MLTRGTIPLVIPKDKGGEAKRVNKGIDWAKEHGLVKSGDMSVIVQGVVEGVSGVTNSFRVHTIP